LCDNAAERREHLFFSCTYSSFLWTLCKLKLELNTNISELEIEAQQVQQRFKSRTRESALSNLVDHFYGLQWHLR